MHLRSKLHCQLELETLEDRRPLSVMVARQPLEGSDSPTDIPVRSPGRSDTPFFQTVLATEGWSPSASGDKPAASSGGDDSSFDAGSGKANNGEPTSSADPGSSLIPAPILASETEGGDGPRTENLEQPVHQPASTAVPSPLVASGESEPADFAEGRTVPAPPRVPPSPTTNSPEQSEAKASETGNSPALVEEEPPSFTPASSGPTSPSPGPQSTPIASGPSAGNQSQKAAGLAAGSPIAIEAPASSSGTIRPWLERATGTTAEARTLAASASAAGEGHSIAATSTPLRLAGEINAAAPEHDRVAAASPALAIPVEEEESPNSDDLALRDRAWEENQPLGAGPLTGGLTLDVATLRAGVQAFLARLDNMREAVWNLPAGTGLSWWLLTAAVAVTSIEMGRRQLSRSAGPVLGPSGELLISWDQRPEEGMEGEA